MSGVALPPLNSWASLFWSHCRFAQTPTTKEEVYTSTTPSLWSDEGILPSSRAQSTERMGSHEDDDTLHLFDKFVGRQFQFNQITLKTSMQNSFWKCFVFLLSQYAPHIAIEKQKLAINGFFNVDAKSSPNVLVKVGICLSLNSILYLISNDNEVKLVQLRCTCSIY